MSICIKRAEEEIAELDGRIVGVKRSLAHLLDLVEQGGLAAVASSELVAVRQAELTDLEAQRAEKERRKQDFAKTLAPEELAAVLVTLREGVSADEVPVARRALKAFVERVVVRGDELRIDYSAEVLLALGEVPPRGFGLKPSTTRPGGWQRAWALAAAWREQLGEGDAGAGQRGRRGRVGRVEGEGGAWARVVTAY